MPPVKPMLAKPQPKIPTGKLAKPNHALCLCPAESFRITGDVL